MSETVEIPWTESWAWTEFPFAPFPSHNEDGVPTTDREQFSTLSRLADGKRFADADGHVYIKVADGPVQSACVVTDGELFDQFGCEAVVYHSASPATAS